MTSALGTLMDASGRVSLASLSGAAVAYVWGEVPVPVQLPFVSTLLIMVGIVGIIAMVKQRQRSDDPWRPWTMSVLLALVGALSVAFAASVDRRLSTIEEYGAAPMRVEVRANRVQIENQADLLRRILAELQALREAQ